MSPGPIHVKPEVLAADPRLAQLARLLKRVDKRLRWQEGVSLLPAALAVSAGIVVVLAVARRFWGLLDGGGLIVVSVTVVVAALLGVGLYALVRRRDILTIARRADHALRLDERLATAIEDAARPPVNASPALISLREAQLDDAVRSVSGARPERVLPLHVSARKFLPLAGLAAVLLAVLLVPDFASSRTDAAAQAQVAVEQKNIEVLKQAIASQPNAAQDPALQKLLQELSSLSGDLQSGDLTKEQALARLSQTEADLQKALDPNAAARREALDQLARQLAASGNEDARQAGQALKNGDTQKAAQALQKAAGDASKMSPDERKALGDSLQQAQASVAPLDPSLSSRLNDAASALQSSDPDATKQALNDLAKQVQETGQQLASQQQIEQALAQIQQSKTNIAQSGQPTLAASSGTAVAAGTPFSGTPAPGGTRFTGTAVAKGTSIPGTPFSGTPLVVAQGSPLSVAPNSTGTMTRVVVSGTLSATGTPILVQGTPGNGTPVVAQGQGQGQSQGQGQGQGQGQDQGQGQGQLPGQGQDQGQGQGQLPGQGQGQNGSGQQSGAPTGGWGTGHQEQVYAPSSSVSANLTPVTVPGQTNPGGEQSSAPVNTDANSTGSSLVPYDQIYGQYQQQAGTALNGDYIPQGYKDLVKDYFTNIAP